MKRALSIAVPVLLVALLIAAALGTRYYLNREPKIEKMRLEPPDEAAGGELFVTVGGAERKIADKASKVSTLKNERAVIYTSPEEDRPGVFSIRVFDARTGKTLKAIFTDVPHLSGNFEEARLANGKRLLVASTFSGLDAPVHLWIVDPERGAIFFQRSAVRVGIDGGVLTAASFRDEDWRAMKDTEMDFTNLDYLLDKASVKPYKIEKLDLEKIAGGAPIEPEKQIALARWTSPTDDAAGAPSTNR